LRGKAKDLAGLAGKVIAVGHWIRALSPPDVMVAREALSEFPASY
jgi:hypothetical protein